MDTYYDSIDSKISDYEKHLEDAPMFLELAIWNQKSWINSAESLPTQHEDAVSL
jgi:hypothetical protein